MNFFKKRTEKDLIFQYVQYGWDCKELKEENRKMMDIVNKALKNEFAQKSSHYSEDT